VTASDPIDPASVWAVVDNRKGWFATDGAWRPVVAGDNRDGWVTFTPDDPMPAGDVVTLTVGAATVNGQIVGPTAQEFMVSADKQAWAGAPGLKPDSAVAPLPEILAAPQSSVYRVGPAAVFAQPLTVQIPVAPGTNPADLDVYYYSESAQHSGWYRGSNVSGWMAPDSRRTVQVGGETCIEIQVNHSGVLQLGQAVKVALGNATPVEVGVEGSWARWLSLGSVLFGLSLLLGTVAARRKRI
jgi:hypothetical protein